MTKAGLIERICDQLSAQLQILGEAARAAHDGATSDESKAEHQYDTRAIEASYIAGAQARRASEVRDALLRCQRLEVADFADGRPIALTALCKLASADAEAWYFLAPCAGGVKVEHDGETVVVLTPAAPLGRALVGQEEGDSVTVGAREYEVVAVL